MHTCMQKPRPSTPTRIGGMTVPEHAKHEKRWVKREPHKYVTCHPAHAGKDKEQRWPKRCVEPCRVQVGDKPTPNNAR